MYFIGFIIALAILDRVLALPKKKNWQQWKRLIEYAAIWPFALIVLIGMAVVFTVFFPKD